MQEGEREKGRKYKGEGERNGRKEKIKRKRGKTRREGGNKVLEEGGERRKQ